MKKFNPLIFLASLGAGGIAVLPFILFQYTIEHGAGLITRAQLWGNNFSGIWTVYYLLLEVIMIAFSFLHIVLTIWFTRKLITWIKNKGYVEIIIDPLKNSTLLAPLISLLMTMNLFIGPIRYFMPALSDNFQSLFLPAMIVWSVLFILSIGMVMYLLSISFKKDFDMSRVGFSWLLHPFLLAMVTTVGTGIAAMTQNPSIAHLAAFMSLMSGSMGLFLLLIKIVFIFKAHFDAPGLPDKNFLPSFLIVIPIITLFAISAFRFGHFLERQLDFHLDSYFYIVIGLSFAFEVWYLLFGLLLLWKYFRYIHFKEYFDTQWGLICPFVAFGALASFSYMTLFQNSIMYFVAALFIFISVFLYIEIFLKFLKKSD